jgi:MYXO-CTERM domain-containing protein
MSSLRRSLVAVSVAALTTVGLALPRAADAFCGFYVAGADSKLYNNATMVVLMRDGTRTVLSMANNYQGPPQNFAMVVPVPVVLREQDVKVLPAEIFDRVDQLAAPRLVEYWEQDPCLVGQWAEDNPLQGRSREARQSAEKAKQATDLGVKIEAEFDVGEYQIVILSAEESTGLDAWLRRENYNIPEGAQRLLEPYVQADSKFFVAKVDARKVSFDAQGMATLSPLRFHYDSREFSLPVRLGLINAQGPQDLLIHVLARGVRYELANYDNVAIPTNLDVKDHVRGRFGQFYAALFDHTLAKNPGAVVTEYAWSAGTCDPCPEPALTLEELVTLGADVLPTYDQVFRSRRIARELQWTIPREFVLTRLHARYDANSLGEDLVFQTAPAIVGGRESLYGDGQLEHGAVAAHSLENNFQACYIIRHPWTGPIDCPNPHRNVWGGPWSGQHSPTEFARDLAFVERGASLAEFVTESAAERIATEVGSLPQGPFPPPKPRQHGDDGSGGCAHCRTSEAEYGAGAATFAGFAMIGLFGLHRRRKMKP